MDPGKLDYSSEMKSFFRDIVGILVERFEKSPDQARELVNVYFQLDVDPLERALLMHSDAENVAADLAAMGEEVVSAAPSERARLSAGW